VIVQVSRKEILERLQREILPLQGYKASGGTLVDIGCDSIASAFPNHQFPTGAMHEFLCSSVKGATASAGFISGILSAFMQRGATAIWISASRKIFPAALAQFDIDADNLLFIDAKNEKHVLWATEEALKCNGLAAVISEIKDFDFTVSRRWQLAVEQSLVSGFILHHYKRAPSVNACVARWKITSMPSVSPGAIPGVGFPRWKVELLKVRNGKPGSWLIEWNNCQLREVHEEIFVEDQLHKKAG
jgi:protein ImuA